MRFSVICDAELIDEKKENHPDGSSMTTYTYEYSQAVVDIDTLRMTRYLVECPHCGTEIQIDYSPELQLSEYQREYYRKRILGALSATILIPTILVLLFVLPMDWFEGKLDFWHMLTVLILSLFGIPGSMIVLFKQIIRRRKALKGKTLSINSAGRDHSIREEIKDSDPPRLLYGYYPSEFTFISPG